MQVNTFYVVKNIVHFGVTSILDKTDPRTLLQDGYLDGRKLLVVEAEVGERLHGGDDLMGGGVVFQVVGVLGLGLNQQVRE